MSVAIRSAGGKVYGFTHGEPMIYDNDYKSWIDLSLNDYYFEYTDLLRDELKKVIKKYPPLNNNNCKIKSLKLSKFDNMFMQRDITSGKDFKKVMLIGNAYKNFRLSSVTAMPLPLQLYTELTIIDKLKNLNYDVIYKAHPEGYFRNKEITFLPKDVFLNKGRFEDQMNDVDVFCFYYTGSTTLYSALLSEKEIIYFDYKISNLTCVLSDKLETKVKIIN
jgi:hypothetical protein